MIKKAFLLLLLIAGPSLVAQETILLKGKIVADSLDGSSINIINLTRETGTVNSPSGDFEIRVHRNDTLLFSSVQYEIVKKTVSEEIFEKGFMEIGLKQHINQLDEVEISNIGLSGNLSNDLSKIKVFDHSTVGIPYSTSKRMAPVERHLHTAGGSPVELLLNTLSGRIKMLKKAREYELLAMMVDKGMDTMPLEFYTQDLQIPDDEIINFMYYCAESPAFKTLLIEPKKLELIEFFKEKAPDFIENRMGN